MIISSIIITLFILLGFYTLKRFLIISLNCGRQDYLPLIYYCLFYIIYFGFGSLILVKNQEYAMIEYSEYIIYGIIISAISMYFIILGYLIFIKRISINFELLVNKKSSYTILILYFIGWLFRFELMRLGLYQKYGYLENFKNGEISSLISIFIQIQTWMILFAIIYPIFNRSKYNYILLIIEIFNSFIIGAKSSIILLLIYYFFINSINYKGGILHYIKYFKFKFLYLFSTITVLLYFSSFITPYAYSRGFMNEDNYFINIITNVDDFISFSLLEKGELSDSKYTSVRLAPVDPLTAIIYRNIHDDIELTKGDPLFLALEMMIPKILYENKPDFFGEDVEEQQALRHFNLPDDDVVGTVLFSGYATLGVLGAFIFSFLLGIFYANCWNLIGKILSVKSSYFKFCGVIFLGYFFIHYLKIEQTFVTATVLNLRNTFVLLVISSFFWLLVYLLISLKNKFKLL